MRTYADRWVLQGWLVDPSVPVQAVAPLLASPQFDQLSQTPLGRVLQARAAGDAVDSNEGWTDLTRATTVALQQAAADRDREQAEWADLRATLREELQADDPVAALLGRAFDQLAPGAADPQQAGGALLAFAAARWVGECGQAPCAGLDRVQAMGNAADWAPQVEPLAAIWRVIALKEALDTLEVGRDTALFAGAAADVSDALLGTGAGPIDAAVLTRQRPDASVWLALGRAVGVEVVEWEGVREAIGKHLHRHALDASRRVNDADSKARLERIARRAIP